MKKTISILMCFCMLISTLVFTQTSASAYTYGTYGDFKYYAYDDGTAEITDYTGSVISVEIPSEINGYTVTSIGDSAFENCTSLESITIPESITSIGYDAFSGCKSLKNITIPDSVTSIRSRAFYNTTYYNNQSNWEDNVLYIGNYLISGKCEVYNEDTWEYETVFEATGTYSIKEGTKTIADEAFGECTRLTNITIPNSVTSIGRYAFYDCSSLISVTIPNSVTSIDDWAFANCSSLTSITIPDSVTSIGDYAFYDCSSLISVTIPDSVTSIGIRPFSCCSSLSSIVVDSNNKFYDSRDNCNAIINTENNELIAGCKNTTIPNSVTSIGEWAFEDCSKLASITIPNSVTNIGDYAFYYCTSLTSITIGNGVTSIGNSAFYNTAYYNNKSNWEDNVLYIGEYLIDGKSEKYNYETDEYETVFEVSGSYSIKEGTKVIAGEAFYDCDSLTSITIPDSVKSIGSGAFYNTAYYNNKSNWVDNVLYIGEYLIDGKYEKYNYETDKYDTFEVSGSYSIKEGTKVIAHSAFEDCTSLTSITIPDSVTSIGYKALGYCYDYDNYEYVKVQGFTITGYTGSEAEKYANDNGFEFISLGNSTNPITPEQSTTQPSTNPEQSTQPSTQPTSGLDDSTTTTVPSHAHSLVLVEKVEPTVDTEGKQAYYKCDCGKYYEDAFGHVEIADIVTYGIISKVEPQKPTNPTVNPTKPTTPTVKPTTPTKPVVAKQTLTTPKVKYTSGKKQIKIKYTKVKNAVGFQVRYRIKGKWKIKNFTTKKSVTKTIKKLKKGTYQIQIRAFAKGKKYYSKWTKVKTVKVK